MVANPLAGEYAYQRLKSEIFAGYRLAGSSLVERTVAQDYCLSVSPIREAAQRLLGERMVERLPGGGYRVSPLDEVRLRYLYIWHGQIIHLAIRSRNKERIGAPFENNIARDGRLEARLVAKTAAELFEFIVDQSGNLEYLHAIRSAGDRLQVVRLAEVAIFSGIIDELQALAKLSGLSDAQNLGRAVRSYHRRRIGRTATLALIAKTGPLPE